MVSPVISLILLLALYIPANAQTTERLSEPIDLKSLIIKMERAQCYGPCPVYSVVITGDGTVTYLGKKFVKVKGRRTLRINAEKLRALVEAFFQINFFSLKDNYEYLEKENGLQEVVTDLPTTTTSVQVNGRSKTVSNYYGAPAALTELESKIDRAAGITKFIKKHKDRLE